jgi:site-specific DNA-cytosine methylase
MWPTPDSGVFNDGQTFEAYFVRKQRERAKGYNGNGGGTTLAMAARLWPTPTAGAPRPIAVWEGDTPRTVLPRKGDNRRNRLKALGNAVVPQVAEVVGRVLVDLHEKQGAA